MGWREIRITIKKSASAETIICRKFKGEKKALKYGRLLESRGYIVKIKKSGRIYEVVGVKGR